MKKAIVDEAAFQKLISDMNTPNREQPPEPQVSQETKRPATDAPPEPAAYVALFFKRRNRKITRRNISMDTELLNLLANITLCEHNPTPVAYYLENIIFEHLRLHTADIQELLNRSQRFPLQFPKDE